jgi:carboxypeptidase D
MHSSEPCPGFSDEKFDRGITNGAAWYTLTGGMQDWNYLNTNDFEITLELGCWKYPPHEQLASFWKDNKPALLSFLERVHMGVKGLVTNPRGDPVRGATVEVAGIAHDIHTNQAGDFFRLLTEGEHSITVSANGYRPQTKLVRVNGAISFDGNSLSALVVNFTLGFDGSQEWSTERDFDLWANMDPR